MRNPDEVKPGKSSVCRATKVTIKEHHSAIMQLVEVDLKSDRTQVMSQACNLHRQNLLTEKTVVCRARRVENNCVSYVKDPLLYAPKG
jgi:hypothetical protein